MNQFTMKLKRFLKSEDGPTAVEYAVMLSLIIVVCLTAVTNIGKNAKTTFTNVSAQLGTSSQCVGFDFFCGDDFMTQAFFPIEAISSLWEIVCFGCTFLAVATAWILAPR